MTRIYSKYKIENLLPMFRIAAKCRNEILDSGFTDNGSAIHSAERILDILGQRVNYSGLTHINNLRNHERAEFSKAALETHLNGGKVFIEHVSPHRAFTREVIEQIDSGANDEELIDFVRKNYELALLTETERKGLDRRNRSQMTPGRLAAAGIEVKTTNEWKSQE